MVKAISTEGQIDLGMESDVLYSSALSRFQASRRFTDGHGNFSAYTRLISYITNCKLYGYKNLFVTRYLGQSPQFVTPTRCFPAPQWQGEQRYRLLSNFIWVAFAEPLFLVNRATSRSSQITWNFTVMCLPLAQYSSPTF